MTHVEVPSAARAYDRRPARIAALLALPLLAACGGGGSGASGTATAALFVAPSVALTLPMGGAFEVHVASLPPGAAVLVTLDGDGDPRTSGDAHVLAGPLTATVKGEVHARVATDGVPAGEHRLLAVRAGSAEALAAAAARVRLAAGGRVTWLGGEATEIAVHVRPLSDGRVAWSGVIQGMSIYTTPSGPVLALGALPADGVVGVLEGADIVAVHPIGGPALEMPLGLAAGPGGEFSVAGAASGGLPDLGQRVTAPPEPPASGVDVGYLATYRNPLATGVVTWGVAAAVAQPAGHVRATAVTYAPDGSRWLALRASERFWVGGRQLQQPDGSSVLVRLGPDGVVVAPVVTLAGDVDVVALAFGPAGDLLVAGTATGPVTFGPSFVRTVDVRAAFVARYDATTGDCLGVALPTAGRGATEANDMDVAANGVVYVSGLALGGSRAYDGVLLDPLSGGGDGFVMALTHDLTPLWARTWTSWAVPGSPAMPLLPLVGVVALPDGGCAAVGYTQAGGDIEGTRFGDGLNLQQDGAVARYAADGDLAWVVRLVGHGDQVVTDVAVDAEGCLLISGASRGPLFLHDRDHLEVRPSVHATSLDGFVLRLDPDGRVR